MEAWSVAVALLPLRATTGGLATRRRSSSGRARGRIPASCAGQGDVRQGGLCGAGAGAGAGGPRARRRGLTWGKSGRRADVDSERLSGTCGQSASGVGGRGGLCQAHAGLGWTPPPKPRRQRPAPGGHPRAGPGEGRSPPTIELVMLRLKAPCPWTGSSRAPRARWGRRSCGGRPGASSRLAASGGPCVGATVPPCASPAKSCGGQSRGRRWAGLRGTAPAQPGRGAWAGTGALTLRSSWIALPPMMEKGGRPPRAPSGSAAVGHGGGKLGSCKERGTLPSPGPQEPAAAPARSRPRWTRR